MICKNLYSSNFEDKLTFTKGKIKMLLEMFLSKMATSIMNEVLSDDPTPEVVPEVKEESSSAGLILGGGVALGALTLYMLSKNKDESIPSANENLISKTQ